MKTEEPNRPDRERVVTESLNSILITVDGPEDTTRRPRRPNVPRFWPPDQPLPGPSKPPTDA